MAAATKDRNTELVGPAFLADDQWPVEADTIIYAGTQVVRKVTGYATPGADVSGYISAGIATEKVDNSGGAAGAKKVNVTKGRDVWLGNANATIANIGATMYVSDDQTVTTTAGNGVISGVLIDVDATKGARVRKIDY